MDPTLDNLLTQKSLKWIFVGGKGGVGKTTTSCSIGALLSAHRSSVLIVSTDPAHNLSDAFGQKFGSKPTLVNGFHNLSCMEMDPADSVSVLGESSNDLALPGASASGSGMDDSMRKMMKEISSALPGIDEALSFAEIMKNVENSKYDVIVFDTAPTGHTLRLLSFPKTLDLALGKIESLKDRFAPLMNQFAPMLGGPANMQEMLLGKLTETRKVIEKVNKQFKNPELTTFVCVCIPEFLSLYETERLIQELAKFEIDTHNIVVNQVLFAEPDSCRKLLARKKMQDKYIDQIHDLYAEDFHVVIMPLRDEEVRGPALLRGFAQNLLTPYKPPSMAQDIPSSTIVVPKLIEKFKLDPKQVNEFLKSVGLPVPGVVKEKVVEDLD